MAELINKRRQLTLSEKLAFIEKLDSGKNLSTLAREFGIPRSTARGIVVNKSKFKLLHDHHKVALHRKRMRFSCYSDIEEAVYMWFKQMRLKNIPVNGPMLQQKAREFAKIFGHKNFEGSSGWLCRFRERHNMSVEAMSGDTGESDITSIGMTDEEIVSCINHNTSLQSQYIVSDVDIKTIESGTINISSLSNNIYSKELADSNDQSSVKDKEGICLCDCSNIARDMNNRVGDSTSSSKLSEAIVLVKDLTNFFQQQRSTPQHIWNCLSDINNFMLGDLSKEISQSKITDYFKQCKCKVK